MFDASGTGKSERLRSWERAERSRHPARHCEWVDTTLITDSLSSRLDAGATLWLVDDVHLATPATVELLSAAAREATLPSQIVFAGRYDPGLSLAKLRGRGSVAEIHESHLRLDSHDIAVLARETHLAQEHLELVEELTEGWSGAVAAIIATLTRQLDSPTLQEVDEAAEVAAGDFAAALEKDLDPDTMDFLLETAVLQVLSNDECAYVTGRRNATELIETARRAGAFVTPLDRTHSTFRAHPLLRRGFLARLAQRRSGTAIATLHRRAAEWNTESGDLLEGITHALDAADFVLAADGFARYITQRPQKPIDQLLRRLERPELDDYVPHLISRSLVMARAGDHDATAALVERLETLSWTGALPHGYQSLRSAIVDLNSLLPRGDRRMSQHALDTIRLDEVDSGGPRENLARYHAAHIVYYLGDLDGAHRDAQSIMRGHRSLGRETVEDQTATLLATNLCALIAHDTGDEIKAHQGFEHARELHDDVYQFNDLHPSARQVHLLVEALCGDAPDTTRIEKLRLVADQSPSPDSRLHALIELAVLHDRLGDRPAALTAVDRAEQVSDTNSPSLLLNRLRLVRVAVDETSILAETIVPITPGERAVFRLLATQLTQAEMSDRLGLSINTVKSHLRAVYQKCGVSTRAEAIDFGARTGLLSTAVPWAPPLDDVRLPSQST